MKARVLSCLLSCSLMPAAEHPGWKTLFNGEDLQGWEVRGKGVWSVMPGGVLVGHRIQENAAAPFPSGWPVTQAQYKSWLYQQAWLYTKEQFEQFDLYLEYWLPRGCNSGVSIRDLSRAHFAIGEADADRPDLAGFRKTTPAHIGYEIQIIDPPDRFPTGSIYGLVPAKFGLQKAGEWNTLEIESRSDAIRVRVNGQLAAETAADPQRPARGPIGLQLHDQFTFILFRDIRIKERAGFTIE